MTEIALGPPLGEATGATLMAAVTSGIRFAQSDAALDDLRDRIETNIPEFEAKLGETAWLPLGGAHGFERLLLVGLGPQVDAESVRMAVGSAARAASKTESVATTIHRLDVEAAAGALTEGFLLGQYRYTRYQSEAEGTETATLTLLGGSESDLDAARRAQVLSEGIALTRDLVNEAPMDKAPESIAERTRSLGDEHGFEVTVYDRAEIISEGFGGLAGVGSGASREPRMVVLDYQPQNSNSFVAFVGKGIVFDSGGLSLKTAKMMETMKTDMAGAAAVLGSVLTIARLGLPVRVLGVMPLTENMPGGSAIRPGDVLVARNGKTIEVLNTDAEGRLVLADGLSLASEHSPDLLVDIATLTGACYVALGDKIAGLWTNNDQARELVLAAAARAGERIWPMPLPTDYRKNIDSDIADMRNTGKTRYGGAINAALLLAEFVGDSPWVHIDMAGPARARKSEFHTPKGGTGFGVPTFTAIAEELASR